MGMDLKIFTLPGRPGRQAPSSYKRVRRFYQDTSNQVVFNSHRRHEDMAALWLDSEGDGDFDLLVTSGGVE